MNGFNAFKYVEDLRESGVPDKQAEAHLRVLHDIVESNLATKLDIKELEQKIVESRLATERDIKELDQKMELKIKELEQKIVESRLATERDIKELDQKMIIKLGTLTVVTIGVLVALSNLGIFS